MKQAFTYDPSRRLSLIDKTYSSATVVNGSLEAQNKDTPESEF